MVFLDMHTSLFLTLKGHAGTGDLGKAVNIICFNAQGLLDVMTHLLRPGLSAKDTGFQLNLILHVPLCDGFAKVCCIGRSTTQNRRFQIRHELQLSVRITGGHGQSHTSKKMGTAIKTRTTCKQTITVANMDNVIFCAACGNDGPGTAFIPDVHILLSVKGHDTFSCGSAGGLNSDTVT